VIVLALIALILGLAGFAFGVRCYLELQKWAKQCQRAEIAIAYNRRVKLRAPLVEWLTWANQLQNDERSTGRVVLKMNKMSVAILRPETPPDKTTAKTIHSRNGTGQEKVSA
jgi:hypothetical protein